MPAPTITTTRTVRLLLALAAGAIAVPVIPWMLWGARLDHAVADWLDPLPPPAVLAAGKKFFYRQIEMELAPAYQLASTVITDNMLGADALEGVTAFVEKRKPHWPGPV